MTKHNWGMWLDRSYCSSPKCKNECGRKMTDEQKIELEKIENHRVSFGYFCGEENE